MTTSLAILETCIKVLGSWLHVCLQITAQILFQNTRFLIANTRFYDNVHKLKCATAKQLWRFKQVTSQWLIIFGSRYHATINAMSLITATDIGA